MNKPNMYYGLNGRPINTHTYPLSTTEDRLIVEHKMLFGTVKVVTEWTGQDMSYKPGQKPQIFQTYVEVKNNKSVVERYAKLDDAITGHKKWSKFYSSPSALVRSIVQ